MYKESNIIVYKRDICKIVEVKKKFINETDYYILEPVFDPSLCISIPTTNKDLRNVLNISEMDRLIEMIPSLSIIEADSYSIEKEYKKLINSNKIEDLMTIIKTVYSRNQIHIDNKKKISDKDSQYYEKALKYLGQEFSIALNKTYKDTIKYIEDLFIK
jgi:RNA polymerase-interacting CarD/CdnL/TRCF family regulator